jgi:hypothetical protein
LVLELLEDLAHLTAGIHQALLRFTSELFELLSVLILSLELLIEVLVMLLNGTVLEEKVLYSLNGLLRGNYLSLLVSLGHEIIEKFHLLIETELGLLGSVQSIFRTVIFFIENIIIIVGLVLLDLVLKLLEFTAHSLNVVFHVEDSHLLVVWELLEGGIDHDLSKDRLKDHIWVSIQFALFSSLSSSIFSRLDNLLLIFVKLLEIDNIVVQSLVETVGVQLINI